MFVWGGGDDGRYGWLGLPEDRAPRRHRHLFAQSEFHKTCAGIVDDIGGSESSAIRQSETILTRF
jgi:hypothetical protein